MVEDARREEVRQRYAALAVNMLNDVPCCGGSECCAVDVLPGSGPRDPAYAYQDLHEVGLQPNASLGCGNPILLANLEPGQIVLDLGSGAGLDVLLSARRVAPGGHAYGVDMTDEMLRLAERNQASSGVDNATFLKGTVERLPLPDQSVDVVISNCVINLAEDKAAVIREAARVLRSGGRFAVADVVRIQKPDSGSEPGIAAWAECISGSITVDDYRAHLERAGFAEIEIDVRSERQLEGGGRIASADVRARRRRE